MKTNCFKKKSSRTENQEKKFENYWLTDILDTENEKISEMEDLAIYTIQNKAYRESKIKLKCKLTEPQWPVRKYQVV